MNTEIFIKIGKFPDFCWYLGGVRVSDLLQYKKFLVAMLVPTLVKKIIKSVKSTLIIRF